MFLMYFILKRQLSHCRKAQPESCSSSKIYKQKTHGLQTTISLKILSRVGIRPRTLSALEEWGNHVYLLTTSFLLYNIIYLYILAVKFALYMIFKVWSFIHFTLQTALPFWPYLLLTYRGGSKDNVVFGPTWFFEPFKYIPYLDGSKDHVVFDSNVILLFFVVITVHVLSRRSVESNLF